MKEGQFKFWIYVLFLFGVFLELNQANNVDYEHAVKILHLTSQRWGLDVDIPLHNECGKILCKFYSSTHLETLNHKLHHEPTHSHLNFINVGFYNIHTLQDLIHGVKPDQCSLPANLTMFESEECYKRTAGTIDTAKPHYHGYSTFHPNSTIQHHIHFSDMNPTSFKPLTNFSSLIKAASFVATNCGSLNQMFQFTNRNDIVTQLRQKGLRVDGLGPCMHNDNPDGIVIEPRDPGADNRDLKRKTTTKYMFSLEIENTLEDGYVTEKPFDALFAGSVPIYFGDAKMLRQLASHPKAIIYFDDYDYDLDKLVKYLNYLMTNETAYEEHRVWRKTYNREKNRIEHPLTSPSYRPCEICKWAVKEIEHPTKQLNMNCEKKKKHLRSKSKSFFFSF